MAEIDLSTITEALSEAEPCGPDLDMAFDMDFMTFSAEIDGVIPTRYFDWDPATLDFKKFHDQIAGFLERTRDIRLLVPLAKLHILQSELDGFAATLDAIHRLLRERWADCHPQPGEFLDLGMGQLATLDDMPNVILPLQHARLAQSRRAGPVSLRKWQLAHGEVNPREGEDVVDLETLAGALAEADAEALAATRDTLVLARDAVAGIRNVCIQEAGYDKAPPIERLPQTLDAAIAMLETVIGGAAADADADAAGETEAGAAEGAEVAVARLPAGAVATREQAIEAMHVAERYFALREPSSPVPVLLREAQAASGRSFYELVSEFMPDTAATAVIAIGKDFWFDVPLSTLDARNPAPDYDTDADDGSAPAMAEDTGLGDDETGDGADPAESGEAEESESPEAEPAAEAEPAEPGVGGTAEAAPSAPVEAPAPAPQPSTAPVPSPSAVTFVARSRAEAVALLERVLGYYRVAEPTSPVPLLVERAIDLSSKNFIELLGHVMPEGSLKAKDK